MGEEGEGIEEKEEVTDRRVSSSTTVGVLSLLVLEAVDLEEETEETVEREGFAAGLAAGLAANFTVAVLIGAGLLVEGFVGATGAFLVAVEPTDEVVERGVVEGFGAAALGMEVVGLAMLDLVAVGFETVVAGFEGADFVVGGFKEEDEVVSLLVVTRGDGIAEVNVLDLIVVVVVLGVVSKDEVESDLVVAGLTAAVLGLGIREGRGAVLEVVEEEAVGDLRALPSKCAAREEESRGASEPAVKATGAFRTGTDAASAAAFALVLALSVVCNIINDMTHR